MIHADDRTSILSAITTLKSSLSDLIEPDFGLLDHLLRDEVLNRRQIASVRSERTVYDRNDALLELLTSEDQCDKFLRALRLTKQQHVVNFIMQNGGQKYNDVVTYLSDAPGKEQTLLSHISLVSFKILVFVDFLVLTIDLTTVISHIRT